MNDFWQRGGGAMPPRATDRAPVKPPDESGNATIVPASVALLPYGNQLILLDCRWQRSVPRVLSLGPTTALPTPGATITDSFPGLGTQGRQTNDNVDFNAGLINDAGVVFRDTKAMACKVEYGHGAVHSIAWFDWKTGSYNLPACSYLRVSAVPWGDWSTSLGLEVSAAVGEGTCYGLHVPTVTGRLSIAGGGTIVLLPVPVKARAWEVLITDLTQNIAVNNVGAATRGAPGDLPGWTPKQLIWLTTGGGNTPNQMRVTNNGGALAIVYPRYFLSL